ncbi:hypothetical protein SAICODRAFT_26294 [Saitoella complicata NRRL Y-17804]|nr:uncharacterized protein SAICODRAFT_26294 [Saitoella complicata NRRL Y-17804]ODQ51875.1 hypothetical protein SAICODRAFT_26294 [Saitoella complicata NRRL Y-17804]
MTIKDSFKKLIHKRSGSLDSSHSQTSSSPTAAEKGKGRADPSPQSSPNAQRKRTSLQHDTIHEDSELANQTQNMGLNSPTRQRVNKDLPAAPAPTTTLLQPNASIVGAAQAAGAVGAGAGGSVPVPAGAERTPIADQFMSQVPTTRLEGDNPKHPRSAEPTPPSTAAPALRESPTLAQESRFESGVGSLTAEEWIASRAQPNTTDLTSTIAPPVIHETVIPHEREEFTQVITRDRHVTHVQPLVVPVLERVFLPPIHVLEKEDGRWYELDSDRINAKYGLTPVEWRGVEGVKVIEVVKKESATNDVYNRIEDFIEVQTSSLKEATEVELSIAREVVRRHALLVVERQWHEVAVEEGRPDVLSTTGIVEPVGLGVARGVSVGAGGGYVLPKTGIEGVEGFEGEGRIAPGRLWRHEVSERKEDGVRV